MSDDKLKNLLSAAVRLIDDMDAAGETQLDGDPENPLFDSVEAVVLAIRQFNTHFYKHWLITDGNDNLEENNE